MRGATDEGDKWSEESHGRLQSTSVAVLVVVATVSGYREGWSTEIRNATNVGGYELKIYMPM